MRVLSALGAALLMAAPTIQAQEARAVRLNGPVPVIDGRLDDSVWQLVPPVPELRQKNPFYRARLSDRAGGLGELPFTTKAELSEDQAAHPPFGTNLTYPIERYVRVLLESRVATAEELSAIDQTISGEVEFSAWGGTAELALARVRQMMTMAVEAPQTFYADEHGNLVEPPVEAHSVKA